MIYSVPKALQFTCRPVGRDWAGRAGRLLAMVWLCAVPLGAQAQENPPVQAYAHRLFLNPAFAGLLSDYSAAAGHRAQMTDVESGFSTQWLSADIRFRKSKNAAGLTFSNDQSQAQGYRKLQAGALYAYHTKLRANLDVSAGLQVGYGSYNPAFQNLVFEDQLGPDGQVRNPSAENPGNGRSSFLTLGGGLLLFTNQLWLGISGHQVNAPSVGEARGNTVAPLWQAHTGYRFFLRNYFAQNTFQEISLVPTVSYAHQRGFQRIDGSLYFNFTPVTVGAGFSHLPGTQNFSSANTITALAGVTHKGFKLGYGYRASLPGNPLSVGPTHEISLSFEKLDYLGIYKRQGSDKNYNRIACPAF